MPYAAVNAARLYYQQFGEGDDVVLLHGAGGNHLAWWQQIPALSTRYRVTAYDARGWGLSRSETGALRTVFGADLVALLDHLGIERVHVVAHSMGGRAVAGILRLDPGRVRSLVLSGTNAGVANDRIREIQEELRQFRGDRGLREHALAPGFAAANPELALLYRQVNALNPPRPKGLLGRPPANYRGSTHEMIAGACVPVLFVVGEHDAITSPALVRESHALVPGSELRIIDGAGHSAYFECAAAWNEAVLDFLARRDGAAG